MTGRCARPEPPIEAPCQPSQALKRRRLGSPSSGRLVSKAVSSLEPSAYPPSSAPTGGNAYGLTISRTVSRVGETLVRPADGGHGPAPARMVPPPAWLAFHLRRTS